MNSSATIRPYQPKGKFAETVCATMILSKQNVQRLLYVFFPNLEIAVERRYILFPYFLDVLQGNFQTLRVQFPHICHNADTSK